MRPTALGQRPSARQMTEYGSVSLTRTRPIWGLAQSQEALSVLSQGWRIGACGLPFPDSQLLHAVCIQFYIFKLDILASLKFISSCDCRADSFSLWLGKSINSPSKSLSHWDSNNLFQEYTNRAMPSPFFSF